MLPPNEVIRRAFARGYTVDWARGLVISPRGKATLGSYNGSGYRLVTVYLPEENPREYRVYAHRMLGYAKWGEAALAEGAKVYHANGRKGDNTGSNLRLGTMSDALLNVPENIRAAPRQPSKARALSDDDVAAIRQVIDKSMSRGRVAHGVLKRLAKRYGVSKTTLSNIGKGKVYVEPSQ